MHHWYKKLMKESPSGLITLFELKAILGLQGMNENANSYVDQVFFTFDMDGAIQDFTRNRDLNPEEVVALIFQKVDVNNEGELTLEEFIEGAKGHDDIMDMLKKIMDLTPVLVIIVEGRRL